MKQKIQQKMKNKNNIIVATIAIMIFFIAFIFLAVNHSKGISFTNEVPANLAPEIATSHTQTITYNLTAEPHFINGGAYLFQNEKKGNPTQNDLVWIANTVVGDLEIKNTSKNTPVTTKITAPLDLNNYSKPTKFYYAKGTAKEREFNTNILNETGILSSEDIVFLKANSYSYKTALAIPVGGSKVHVTYEIGDKYTEDAKVAFHTFANGTQKYQITYYTPFNVTWHGTVQETKEIKTTPDFTTSVGKTHNLKAEVRTKTGTSAWSSYEDVTNKYPETVWGSDNPKVVSVDENGNITALKNGTATITAHWKSSDGDYYIRSQTVVKVQNEATIDITGDTKACIGTDVQLSAVIGLPNGTSQTLTSGLGLSWNSSQTSVATISSSGKVTPKASGTTVILASYNKDGVNVSTTMKLQVTNCATADLLLELSNDNVCVGKTVTAIVKYTKGNGSTVTIKNSDATWTSSKTNIATVDKGIVTAKAVGTTSISVNYGGITKSLTVTVSNCATNDLDLTLNNANVCINETATATLKYKRLNGTVVTINNKDAAWSSSNENIAKVQNGVVTGKNSGVVTITATYGGITATVDLVITNCSATTPINENQPPTVSIIGTKEIEVGTNVCFRAQAYDSDGFINLYEWSIANNFITDDINSSAVCGLFTDLGTYDLEVYVEDNGDENGNNIKSATAQHTVKVVMPKPQAYVFINGIFKENRKITLQASHAYGGNDFAYMKYPITKQTLTKMHISHTTLHMKFKKATNYTFNDFVNRYRIVKAIEFLKDERCLIYEVASKVGFIDYKYFSQVFKKYTGFSPSNFM